MDSTTSNFIGTRRRVTWSHIIVTAGYCQRKVVGGEGGMIRIRILSTNWLALPSRTCTGAQALWRMTCCAIGITEVQTQCSLAGWWMTALSLSYSEVALSLLAFNQFIFKVWGTFAINILTITCILNTNNTPNLPILLSRVWFTLFPSNNSCQWYPATWILLTVD